MKFYSSLTNDIEITFKFIQKNRTFKLIFKKYLKRKIVAWDILRRKHHFI